MSWRLKISSSCRGLRRPYEPSGLDLGWRSELCPAESDLLPDPRLVLMMMVEMMVMMMVVSHSSGQVEL